MKPAPRKRPVLIVEGEVIRGGISLSHEERRSGRLLVRVDSRRNTAP